MQVLDIRGTERVGLNVGAGDRAVGHLVGGHRIRRSLASVTAPMLMSRGAMVWSLMSMP